MSDFREAVRRKFGCAPEAYAETVFWHCLYPHARLPAKLVRSVKPSYFRQDFELLELIADSTTFPELRGMLGHHRQDCPPKPLLGQRLRIRLSTRRVMKLAGEVLAQTSGAS